MYKLVLIDDEEYVRRALRITVNWVEYDINLVGEASNGEDALELILQEKPDIVITDIYMPKLNGLKLTQKVKEILPNTKVIILSGYEEFQYAQSALRNKAFDYILKPVEIEDIIKVIQMAQKQIDFEQNKLRNEKELEKQLKESLPILREKYLKYLLNGSISFDYIMRTHQYLQIKIDKTNITTMVIEIDNLIEVLPEKEQLHVLKIKKELAEIINDSFQAEIIDELAKKLTVIINFKGHYSHQKNQDLLEKLSLNIIDYFTNNYNYLVNIGIGRLYRDMGYLNNSYNEALEALEYKIFQEAENIFFYDDVAVIEDDSVVLYPYNLQNKIVTSLKIGDIKNIDQYLSDFFKYFLGKEQISPDIFKNYCIQLIYFVLQKMAEWKLLNDLDNGQRFNLEEKIYTKDSYREIENWLNQFLKNIATQINQRKLNKNQDIVEQAYQYIKENYDQDLSLEDIASAVHLTRTYFANFFKDKTGKTVISYLTDFRIEKAKQLLVNSDLKIYEIAEKVGYNNPNYFAQVFKKKTFISPNTYRKEN